MQSTSPKPALIIIGAGRSGTNMLRDLLVQIPGLGTWPCDEINYIWRYGNARYPTDEFSPNQVTESNAAYIHRAFDKVAKNQGIDQVVEKTCANSLRVGFVDSIFPDARYIYIVRDGRDVVNSAMKRWAAPLDLPYVLRKARYVPLGDMPYYGFRYLWNHIYRLGSGAGRQASWGPRFEGMETALRSQTLSEVCALQWRRCIERSDEDLAKISPARVHRLCYESFVEDPAAGINHLAGFLDIQLSSVEISRMIQFVSAEHVGKWRSELSVEDQERVRPLIESLLSAHEYV
jgi:hypothetical protein